MWLRSRVVILMLVTGAPWVRGEETDAGEGGRYDAYFRRRAWEGMVGVAGMFSPVVATRGRPQLDYAVAVGQVGYMLTEVAGRGVWRGNWEVVGEVFGGGIHAGRGSYVSGMTLWGRYNFVPTGVRLSPFAGLGLGCGLGDKDRNVFGGAFGFNLDAGVGLRCFVGPRTTLVAEYRFQHISNANLSPHNLGINAHGPMVGLGWMF